MMSRPPTVTEPFQPEPTRLVHRKKCVGSLEWAASLVALDLALADLAPVAFGDVSLGVPARHAVVKFFLRGLFRVFSFPFDGGSGLVWGRPVKAGPFSSLDFDNQRIGSGR